MMKQLKELLANVQTWFQALSTREKRMVLGAGSAVVVFVLFLILFSLSSTASSIQRRTQDKLLRLQDVQTLAQSYREADAQRQNIERQLGNNGIKLISYIEEKGTAAGLDIQTMNPKGDVPIGDGNIIESSVELTLTDIAIDKLVKFLSNVEMGGMVKVKFLRIEPRVPNQTLTAWATIATYRLKQ